MLPNGFFMVFAPGCSENRQVWATSKWKHEHIRCCGSLVWIVQGFDTDSRTNINIHTVLGYHGWKDNCRWVWGYSYHVAAEHKSDIWLVNTPPTQWNWNSYQASFFSVQGVDRAKDIHRKTSKWEKAYKRKQNSTTLNKRNFWSVKFKDKRFCFWMTGQYKFWKSCWLFYTVSILKWLTLLNEQDRNKIRIFCIRSSTKYIKDKTSCPLGCTVSIQPKHY